MESCNRSIRGVGQLLWKLNLSTKSAFVSVVIDIQVCKWFVFELVALLTMLLLLSLGIFLLGLCFFTTVVRVVVGRTTHAAVVLWATFFVLALLAPSDLVGFFFEASHFVRSFNITDSGLS